MVDRNLSSMTQNVHSNGQGRVQYDSYDDNPRPLFKQQYLPGYEKMIGRLSHQAEMPNDDRQSVPSISNPNTYRTANENDRIPDEHGDNKKAPLSRFRDESQISQDLASNRQPPSDNVSRFNTDRDTVKMPPTLKYKPGNLQEKGYYAEPFVRNVLENNRAYLEDSGYDPDVTFKEKYWQSEILSVGDHSEPEIDTRKAKTHQQIIEGGHQATSYRVGANISSQNEIAEAHLILFSGGNLLGADSQKSYLISEEYIYQKFQAFYNDILPFVINFFRDPSAKLSPEMVLILNEQKKIKVKQFGNNKGQTAKPYITYKPSFNLISLFQNHLHGKFQIIQPLPLTEKSSNESEYYLVEENKTSNILIVKIFPYTLSINEAGKKVFLALHFKVAEKSLGQMIKQAKANQQPLSVPLLRSLYFSVVQAGYELQRQSTQTPSLHPDFIFYDSVNQTFQVLSLPVMNPIQTNQDSSRVRDEEPNTMPSRKLPSQMKTHLYGHPDYLSPLLYKAFISQSRECVHNPYKSAVFSLGLILYEAFTLRSPAKLLASLKQLTSILANNPLILNSLAIGVDYLHKAPSVFELLLPIDEESRYDFVTLFFYCYADLPSPHDPFYAVATSVIPEKTGGSANRARLQYENSDSYYIGAVYGNARHGAGSFYDGEGNLIFKGLWEDNFPKEGVYYYGGGYRYEGSLDGPLHEGKGILFYRDMPLYRGEWRNFKFHGRGQLYFEGSDKVQYEGEFRVGLKFGSGQLFYPDGTLQYSGYFKDGRMNDRGSLFWPSGLRKFEGEIVSEGFQEIYLKGTFYDDDDRSGRKPNYFVGELYHEKYHGTGTLYSGDGKVLKSGEWVYGELADTIPSQFNIDELRKKIFRTVKKAQETWYTLKGDVALHIDNITTHEFNTFVDFNNKDAPLRVSLMGIENDSLQRAFELVTHNPYFRRIDTLILSKFDLQSIEKQLQMLLESYNLKDLKKLWIVESLHFDDFLCKILAEATCLAGVEELVIESVGMFSTEGLKTIFNSAFLSNLKKFSMKHPLGSLDRDTALHLSSSLYLKNLQSLSLAQCNLRVSSVRAIFENDDSFSLLKSLNLSYNNLTSRACKYMMEATNTQIRLEKLSLKSCDIDARGVYYLANARALIDLRNLNLSYNPIGNTACDAIASTEVLAGLTRLGLSSCSIGLRGLQSLCETNNSKNLQRLELSDNEDLDDQAVELIANTITLGNLQILALERCRISIDGLKAICGSFRLKGLKKIILFGKTIGKEIRDQLQKDVDLENDLIIE